MGKKGKAKQLHAASGPVAGAAGVLANAMLVFEDGADGQRERESTTEEQLGDDSYLDIGDRAQPNPQTASPGGMRRRISGPVGKVFQV